MLRVCVLNTKEEEVNLYVNMRIAIAEQVELVDSSVSTVTLQQGDLKKEEMLQRLVQASNSELTKGEQDMFLKLLQQYM